MSRGIGSRVVRWLAVAAMCALPVQGVAGNVNTADIVDGAVTTPKIADGAVTAAKLGIVCPDGQYLKYTAGSGWACNVGTPGLQGPQGVAGPQGATGPQGPAGVITNGSVTTETIADGAVTSAKIGGAIGVDKIGSYAGVKVVHKGAADGLNTFSSINAALASITDNSAANIYVIVVMPGVYEEVVNMPSYVHLVGQSRTGSIIKGAVRATSPGTYDVNDIAIKNLTIDGSAGVAEAAVYIFDSEVTVESCNIITSNQGLMIYSFNNGSTVVADDLNIKNIGDGFSVYTNGDGNYRIGNVTINNLTSTGSGYGVGTLYANSAVTKIRNSTILNDKGAYVYQALVDFSNTTFSNPVSGIFYRFWGRATFNGCRILSPGTAFTSDENGNSLRVNNSEIVGGFYQASPEPADIKISNSKLDTVFGQLNPNGTIKLVNCFDTNYNPIPNGTY